MLVLSIVIVNAASDLANFEDFLAGKTEFVRIGLKQGSSKKADEVQQTWA